jgi:UDP-glucose 4-epimerase
MILVTGASGFVGKALSIHLSKKSNLRVSVRDKAAFGCFEGLDVVEASLSENQDWSNALDGISTVIHCAARVHVMNENVADPLIEYRRINVDGTLRLARQSAELGVRRFVFVSSIKVNGEHSHPDQPFTADQIPEPGDPYGVSKSEAEAALRDLAEKTGMEVVIIRPPLVYGPGVKANFLTMMCWLHRGVPLPLGGVTGNMRSLVFLDNLVDLIARCIDHPSAANQIFLVSDDDDLSTTELLRRMAVALGCPARLIRIPAGLILLGAQLIGRPSISQRLCGSLAVDIGKTKALLGWLPPVSVDEGLRITADHWRKSLESS